MDSDEKKYQLDQSMNDRFEAKMAESKEARKPVRMNRANAWNLNVENTFRLQTAGYRDLEEYLEHHPVPDLWESENGSSESFIKCLRSKKTGYFMYYRKSRECEDKYLNRVIFYEY